MRGADVGAVADGDGARGDEPAQPLHVVLVCEDGDWTAFADAPAAVGRAAAALAAHLGCRLPGPREASVVLGSDALLARLNGTYRGRHQATNVLSFPYQKPATGGEEGYLGDVVLAAETICREASAGGIPPTAHLQHLVVHGLLHLLGHDHENDAEAEVMEALESAILAAIGVADPHDAERL
jgi:probable rRNA maturation factor